ncbi:hypothetical protein [Streptomyces sp. NPDC090036]
MSPFWGQVKPFALTFRVPGDAEDGLVRGDKVAHQVFTTKLRRL